MDEWDPTLEVEFQSATAEAHNVVSSDQLSAKLIGWRIADLEARVAKLERES